MLSRVQSLHVLFSLYSAFKNSQHFNQLAQENNMDNNPQGNGDKIDRIEFWWTKEKNGVKLLIYLVPIQP